MCFWNTVKKHKNSNKNKKINKFYSLYLASQLPENVVFKQYFLFIFEIW